jgi:predicted transcriptional regulator
MTTAAAISLKGNNNNFNPLLLQMILNAINDNIGKGAAYNNNIIDDPGATISNIASTARLDFPRTKLYLQLLADQGLIMIEAVQRKRAPKRNKRRRNISKTVTTVKLTEKGYEYLSYNCSR